MTSHKILIWCFMEIFDVGYYIKANLSEWLHMEAVIGYNLWIWIDCLSNKCTFINIYSILETYVYMFCVLLFYAVGIFFDGFIWCIYPYSSGLLHWHWRYCIITPVPSISKLTCSKPLVHYIGTPLTCNDWLISSWWLQMTWCEIGVRSSAATMLISLWLQCQ